MSSSTIIEVIYIFIGQVSCTAVLESLDNIKVCLLLCLDMNRYATLAIKILLKMLHKINALDISHDKG